MQPPTGGSFATRGKRVEQGEPLYRLNERHYGALQGLNKAETGQAVRRGTGPVMAAALFVFITTADTVGFHPMVQLHPVLYNLNGIQERIQPWKHRA
jgi:hypothetical protein